MSDESAKNAPNNNASGNEGVPAEMPEYRKVESEYGADQLEHLSDLEHVRERPSMYIGDTGLRGLHHLVYEVVDNSIDEAMAGVCRNIDVRIGADSSVSVADDGRGFPVGIKPEFGMSALALCLTELGPGANFDR